MKIAIISSGYFPVVDGVTTTLHHRLKTLSQLGHQVLVFCPDYREIQSVYPDWQQHRGEIFPGVRIVSLPSEPFMGVEFERNLSTKANRSLEGGLEVFSPDIIHVDEPDRIFLGLLKAPGVAYAKKNSIPCIGFYHTNFIDYIEDFLPLPPALAKAITPTLQWVSMLFIRPVFQAYDAILTASPVTQQRLESLKVKNAVCDRYLGTDIQTFTDQTSDPNFFQTHYNINNTQTKIKLTFLGRLTPDKGWKFTLRALSDWAADPENADYINQVVFIIAGEGDLRAEIESQLQQTGLSYHLLGRIVPAAVPPLLANSDIHITTSEKETLGLTVLEAFAAGIPVIAPNAGGVVTHIRSGQNGLLFDPQSSVSFSQKLTSLIASTELRKKMGQQAQQNISSYSHEKAVATLIETWRYFHSKRTKRPLDSSVKT